MKSIEHTGTFEMAVPVSTLFPLFSPEGERSWVPGWEYENLMGTAELSEDYVFLTKAHDHGTTVAIWLVKRYDREAHLVEFYKVEPDDKVGVVKVKCTRLAAEKSEVEVTYKYLALSPTGERFVSGFTNAVFEAFIGEWQELLTRYFASRC
jgi:hypothetical protein